MPSELIWRFVPQFRVPFYVLLLLCSLALLPLAAFGLEGRVAALPPRQAPGQRRVRWRLRSGDGRQLCRARHPPAAGHCRRRVRSSPVRAVRAAPPGALVEYPFVRSDIGVNSEYLFWQRIHELPSARHVRGAGSGRRWIDPTSPETASFLPALGVSDDRRQAEHVRLLGTRDGPRNVGRGYRLIGRFPRIRRFGGLLPVRPPPSRRSRKASLRIFPTTGQPTSRWMIASEADVMIYAWRAGTYDLRNFLSVATGARGSSRLRTELVRVLRCECPEAREGQGSTGPAATRPSGFFFPLSLARP